MNFGEDVLMYLNKCISVKLCPPVTGQTAMECIVNPPKEGEPSYELHQQVKLSCRNPRLSSKVLIQTQ